MTANSRRQVSDERGPLSRVVRVDDVPASGLPFAVRATAAECADVAAAIGLVAVRSLEATLLVARRAGERFVVTGDLSAAITQTCVVTLEPFDATVSQAIDLVFADAVRADAETWGASKGGTKGGARGRAEAMAREAVVVTPGNDDQVDPPDPVIDGAIDLGAVTVEFLSLACDPYPRKPDVAFDETNFGEAGEPAASPFAALKQLKDRS